MIVNFLKKIKFRTKLLLIFAVSSLIPLLFFFLISLKANDKAMMDSIGKMNMESLRGISDKVNSELEHYTDMLYQMNQDDNIISEVKILNESDSEYERAVASSRIMKTVKQYNNMEDMIRSITLVCANGQAVIYDSMTDSIVENLWSSYSNYRMIPPYRDAEGRNGMSVTSTVKFKDGDDYRYYFHLSRRIFDLENLDKGSIATIIISVDENQLDDICNPIDDGEDDVDDSINFITDADGLIISFPDKDHLCERVEKENIVDWYAGIKNSSSSEYECSVYEDATTGWTFYNIYDKRIGFSDVRRVQYIFIWTALALMALAIILILCFSNQLNGSVKRLVDGMEEVERGNFDVYVTSSTQDEMGIMADHFNSMTARVKELIDEVEKVTVRKKDAEIKALEAQINPHFLYNTLDSINWMAIDHEEYEISKMLRDLGIILRYSIGKSNAQVKISMMTVWLEKYISLQRVRFNDSFEYCIEVGKDCEDALISKLLIQPFIENAILHGLKDKESGGKLGVFISRSEDGNRIVISIEDNGSGLDEKIVERYNDPEKATEEGTGSIGMYNAFSRLKMYYGDKASWKITSFDGAGTIIMITIPIIMGEEDEDINS